MRLWMFVSAGLTTAASRYRKTGDRQFGGAPQPLHLATTSVPAVVTSVTQVNAVH